MCFFRNLQLINDNITLRAVSSLNFHYCISSMWENSWIVQATSSTVSYVQSTKYWNRCSPIRFLFYVGQCICAWRLSSFYPARTTSRPSQLYIVSRPKITSFTNGVNTPALRVAFFPTKTLLRICNQFSKFTCDRKHWLCRWSIEDVLYVSVFYLLYYAFCVLRLQVTEAS